MQRDAKKEEIETFAHVHPCSSIFCIGKSFCLVVPSGANLSIPVTTPQQRMARTVNVKKVLSPTFLIFLGEPAFSTL